MAKESAVSRREFLSGVASAGAVIATGTAAAQPKATTTAACNPTKVIASDRATVVETTSGKVRGYMDGETYVFLGIPYAASPAGKNRFLPPQPVEPWPGIRNAIQYGHICPSRDNNSVEYDGKNLSPSAEDAFLLHRSAGPEVAGEDCLRLNVWTPEINESHKRPVLVYMHGGGYTGGSDRDLLSYQGVGMARNQDMVVVNHNHRLNVLGYLDLGSLTQSERFADAGNAGVLDMVAVLRWVQENIARFGGDPTNVTIAGQSGGGGKVINLMAVPMAQGLFHRAIVQSGPFLKSLDRDYSRQLAQGVMTELGLSVDRLDELQTVQMDKLQGAAAAAMKKMPSHPQGTIRRDFGTTNWGPVVDGRTLPHHPFDPQAPSISADVPLLTGTNLNEFVSGLDNPNAQSMTEAQMQTLVAKEFPQTAQAIIRAYRKQYPRMSPFDTYAVIAASCMRIPSFQQALRKVALGAAPAYAYVYSWRTPMLDDRCGTFHACEIAFAFDNGAICTHYSGGLPAGLQLSSQMGGAWAAFARTGNPNHSHIPHWSAYTASTKEVMYLDAPCRTVRDPEGEGLSLIASA